MQGKMRQKQFCTYIHKHSHTYTHTCIHNTHTHINRKDSQLSEIEMRNVVVDKIYCFSCESRRCKRIENKILKYAPTRINYLTYSTLFIILDFAFGLVCTGALAVSCVCVSWASSHHTCSKCTHNSKHSRRADPAQAQANENSLHKWKYLLWFGCITKTFIFRF